MGRVGLCDDYTQWTDSRVYYYTQRVIYYYDKYDSNDRMVLWYYRVTYRQASICTVMPEISVLSNVRLDRY